MAISPPPGLIRFGVFELDLRSRQLSRKGVRVRLPQQPIQVLCVLLDRPGEVVTREELHKLLWPEDVFVDFDLGLNKSVQKLREALGDSPGSPLYIETVPRIGYRFIAPVNGTTAALEADEGTATPMSQSIAVPPAKAPIAEVRRAPWFLLAACAVGVAACVALTFGGMALYRWRHRQPEVKYTQLTDFTDSAAEPALSPDGRMVAFIRGGETFITTDQIYVKMLPNGEARRVTDDNRPKYGLAFSPDGSEIAYTVLENSGFSTYEVSSLGGEPHLLLKNAAGLVWLAPQRLLFSETHSGIHMGVVTASVTREGQREIYFPAHERGMAHYSIPSPDRRWALVVEMDGNGDWAQCRLVDLKGQSSPRLVGPKGACTSAGWSTDGEWMYFTAWVEGQSHIWRQGFQDGAPEQITFGPTEEVGVAVEPAGAALITSVGAHKSDIWIHDAKGERSLSSEGDVASELSPPEFSSDATILYYLLRREEGLGAELWRTAVETGKSEVVFPGISMSAFDVSADGKQVVFTTEEPGGTTQLWLAHMDRSVAATKLGVSGARSPHFGAGGQILFQKMEGNVNYLEQVNPDGSHLSKMLPYPIIEFQGVSPGGRWVMAALPRTPAENVPEVAAIPLNGAAPRRICENYCIPRWSTDGKFLFVTVEEPSRTGAGRSLAIPVGPGESLPDLPAGGIEPMAEPSTVQGAESIGRGEFVPGKDRAQYAWVNTVVHRNLYRVSLP